MMHWEKSPGEWETKKNKKLFFICLNALNFGVLFCYDIQRSFFKPSTPLYHYIYLAPKMAAAN